MPTLFQGFGTTFLGKRDFWPDGSYVTTEWFVVCLVPVFPLKGLRLKESPRYSTTGYPLFSFSRDYAVMDEGPPHLRQVLSVYTFSVCYVAWSVGASFLLFDIVPWVLSGRGRFVGYPAVAVIVGLPWIVPWFLRERARRWRPGFK
jgi:hypothetical protein